MGWDGVSGRQHVAGAGVNVYWFADKHNTRCIVRMQNLTLPGDEGRAAAESGDALEGSQWRGEGRDGMGYEGVCRGGAS